MLVCARLIVEEREGIRHDRHISPAPTATTRSAAATATTPSIGGDGDDIISGGNGVDTLFGDGGNDQLYGDNGTDHLDGGAGDDLLDGRNGFDTAYYSGRSANIRSSPRPAICTSSISAAPVPTATTG